MILLISPTDLIAQSHKVFNLATEVQASKAKPAGTGLSLKKKYRNIHCMVKIV